MVMKLGLISICLFALIVLIGFFSLHLGSVDLGFDEIYLTLIGKMHNDTFQTILFEIRLPRIIMALLIGMLLASSGVVVQSLFANPIADPYIIGIASSATFGAVLAYLLHLPDFAYGLIGFISCTAFSFFIFKVRSSISTLLIVGIALSSFLGAFTSFAIYIIGEDSFKITAWLMGYLGSASWQKNLILLPPTLFCILFFYLKRYELDVILLGDDEARSLGVDAQKSKRILLIVASLCVAFSVAFTGLIGFVGLIIPHTIRMILKTSSNVLLIPLSILFGSLFLLLCDTIGRVIFDPVEIPIGIITAFFGAPFFLYLAMKTRGYNV